MARAANNIYYVDGLLTDGHWQKCIQKAPFEILSIGNYGDKEEHNVANSIWIQFRLYLQLEREYRPSGKEVEPSSTDKPKPNRAG